MCRGRRARVLITAGTLGALAAITVAMASGALDPLRTVGLSKAEAVERVVSFAGIGDLGPHDLVVEDPADGSFNRIYVVKGAGISATVDVNDGRVVSLLVYDAVPTDDAIKSTPEEAVFAARAFCRIETCRGWGWTSKSSSETMVSRTSTS
jgi:hypothetical protein